MRTYAKHSCIIKKKHNNSTEQSPKNNRGDVTQSKQKVWASQRRLRGAAFDFVVISCYYSVIQEWLLLFTCYPLVLEVSLFWYWDAVWGHLVCIGNVTSVCSEKLFSRLCAEARPPLSLGCLLNNYAEKESWYSASYAVISLDVFTLAHPYVSGSLWLSLSFWCNCHCMYLNAFLKKLSGYIDMFELLMGEFLFFFRCWI